MSIKLRGTRNRRSYADYKPASRRQGPRNDPFRIIFYIVLIIGAGWVYLNANAIRVIVMKQFGSVNIGGAVSQQLGPTPTPTPQPEQFAGLALEAYKAGNIDRAIEMYTKAGEYAPNSVEYHFQVARLLLFKSALQTGAAQENTLKQASEAANKAILANPEKPDGYAILGKILDWQGQPDQAITQISRALEPDKNYALGNSYMAEALVDLQRWDQAQTAIDLAISLDPKNPDILRDYGYVLESQQDYVGAAAQYEAALAIEPNQPYIKMSLALNYRSTQKYTEALDQLFAVDTLSPKNPVVEYQIGLTYESYVGDQASALKYYEQATQADPNYASPWIRLGAIHYVQGSYQQAIPDFEQAIKLGITDKPSLFVQLAMAYANQNRCDQALVNLQKAEALVKPEQTDLLDQIKQGYKQCPVITPSPTSRPGVKPSATPKPK